MSKTGTDASRMRFGDFELRREIGRGGMGTVYEAWQRSLQRVVALKIMGGHVSSSATAVLRFQREAQAAAKLQHSNIIPIYAQGDEAGVYYYAMEYVQGRSLNHVIAEFRASAGLDVREPDVAETVAIDRSGASAKSTSAVKSSGEASPSPSASGNVVLSAPSSSHRASEHFRFVAQHMAAVADALDYAHKRGVIHRDIKPHNLILGDDGRMRVSDFGLARLMEQPGVTMTGEVIGSPLYMAPEQIAGGPGAADHRADIYSLGATMYEWIALVPPYPGETRERVISMILTAESPSPRAHNPQIPLDLETICNKAIERDPTRRYQTAADLRDDLHRYLTARPILAKRAGLMDRSRRFVARHPLGTLAAAAACVALALSAALYNSKKSEQKQSVLLQEEKAKTKQIVEEADRVWSALQLASGAVLPEPMAERAGPMLQNLFQSGQKIAGGTGGFSKLLGPSAAPFTPLGIAERAAVDLFSELRPKSTSHSENAADMAGQLFGQALAMWPANMATALSTVEVILNVKKDDFDARHYHAALSAGLKNFAGIANDGEELIRMRSNDAIGFLWRGMGKLLLDDAKTALADFEKAIELNPTSMWSRALRGLSLIRMGRPMDALDEFNQVLVTSPHLVVALMGRANAHRAIGNMPQALVDLTRVIELEPQNADALAARSEVHRALSNVVEAEEDLRKVMELTGASPTLLMQLLLEQAKTRENTAVAPPSPPSTDTRINADAQPPQPPASDKSSRNAPLVAPWRRPSPEPPAHHGVFGTHRFRFLGVGW